MYTFKLTPPNLVLLDLAVVEQFGVNALGGPIAGSEDRVCDSVFYYESRTQMHTSLDTLKSSLQK